MAFDYKRMLHRELNVGLKERRLRYYGGAASAFISVFLGNIPLLLLGMVLIATAYTRWCPVYSGMTRSSVNPAEEAPPESAGAAH
jgi:hypothetical protein